MQVKKINRSIAETVQRLFYQTIEQWTWNVANQKKVKFIMIILQKYQLQ